MNRRSHLQILGPEDTAFYYVDRPETPMNIGAVCIFDGKIPFDDFLKMVESRIYRAPLYQQRVIQAPLTLGQPSWVLDPDFYVGNHVMHVELPEPGTEEQLREFAGHLVSGMLDRDKPLWELYVIDGLEGDRSALVFKVHHCMVDGLAAVELFTLLMDLTEEPPPVQRPPVYDPPYLPSPTELVTRAIRADLPHRWGVLKKIGGDAARLGAVLSDKEKRRQTLVGIANLVNDNLTRIKPLPINGQNTGRITLAWAEFSLAEVKAIRASQHVSINEVMLAVLGGAVARYMGNHPTHIKQEFMRVIVPVTMRHEDEKDDYGNRISVLPIDLPFHVSDPLERLRKVSEYSQIMKQSSLTIGLDLVLTLPSLSPSFTQPLIWGIAPLAFTFLGHSWCTNVAGPPLPVFVLGHRMLHSYGYFPLNPSMGLATVILSYHDRITMTLVADSGIIPDVLDLRDSLHHAYTALRQAAKVPEMPLAVETKPAPKAVAPTPAAEQPKPLPTLVVEPAPLEATAVLAADPSGVEPIKPVTATNPPAETPKPVESSTEVMDVPGIIDPPVGEPPKPVERAPEVMNSVEVDPPAAVPAAEVPPAQAPVDADATVAAPAVVETPIAQTSAASPAPTQAAPTAVIELIAAANNLAATDPVPVAQNHSNGKNGAAHPPKLFSEEWAQAYQHAINNNPAYRSASLRWDAGQLAFVIHASPRHGFVTPAAVLLDLHRGECRTAHNTPVEVVMNTAAFVIEGDYANWIKVLSGAADPLRMLVSGGLRLQKGSMFKLLPFTQSAQELVRSAQHIQ